MMRANVDALHRVCTRPIPARPGQENRALPRRSSEGPFPLSDSRPVVAAPRVGCVARACAQLAFLLWAARALVPQALHCDVCDTSYYYNAAAELAKAGLLFSNPYDGYRSYFVPLVIAVVHGWRRALGFDGEPGGALYVRRLDPVLARLRRPDGVARAARRARRTFVQTTAATLLNPFLLVYVPFALQEGVLMACCLPLLFLWVGAKDWDAGRRAALVLSMALLAYIIRAALVWWLLPAALYAAWLLWPRRRQARRWLPWMAAVVVAGVPRHRPRRSTSRSSIPIRSIPIRPPRCSRSRFPSASRCSSSRPSKTKGIGAGSPTGRRTSRSPRRRRPPTSTSITRRARRS